MQPNLRPGPGASAEPDSAEEALVALLMQARGQMRARHPEDQMDPSSFPLAKTLLHHPAGMRVSDLAAKVDLDQSTVSRQIKQLEDKGIVQRAADPADGRASLVQLSEHGEAILLAGFKRRLARIRTVLSDWSEDDREQLKVLLTRLAIDLRAANDRDAADPLLDASTGSTNAPGSDS